MARHKEYDLYDDVEKIKAALAHAATDVRGKAGEMIQDSVQNVTDKADEARESVVHYTTKNPFKSLGIALLVGVSIGFLMRK